MTNFLIRCMPIFYFFAGIAVTVATLNGQTGYVVGIVVVSTALALVVADLEDRVRFRREMQAASSARAEKTLVPNGPDSQI